MLGYRSEHARRLSQYVVIPDPQDPVSHLRQFSVACSVARILRMLTAIKLDYKSMLGTEEVGHVVTDWLLPPKLGASQITIPQMSPEESFCVGGLASELLRQVSSSTLHPHPFPLPLRERGPDRGHLVSTPLPLRERSGEGWFVCVPLSFILRPSSSCRPFATGFLLRQVRAPARRQSSARSWPAVSWPR
jgi:hypothetical protein